MHRHIKILDSEQTHSFVNTNMTARKFQRGGAPLYFTGFIQEFLMGISRVGELEKGGGNSYHQTPQISVYFTVTSGHVKQAVYSKTT